MTVYFIGAGPGAADLITVRGQRLIERCAVCLYAGSLVPAELVAAAPAGALVRDTSKLDLDEIIALLAAAHGSGEDVARVHSGDPSLYGAIGEQMRRLDALDIPYEVVPGVPAFAGAAARLNAELTLPDIAQTVILTRVSSGSSPMPESEDLEILARSRATLALHLAMKSLPRIATTLTPHYGADCPVIVVYRATWPDEKIIRTTLDRLVADLEGQGIARTALVFVGRVFGAENFRDSKLYAKGFAHHFRDQAR
ncbi:MAG TPA: precorrin-4 C(11)-methyltransferase [Devosiaceae bacterium]|jgi:precorrin-4/cobalt-precorrin-4 C11-methyltransferase